MANKYIYFLFKHLCWKRLFSFCLINLMKENIDIDQMSVWDYFFVSNKETVGVFVLRGNLVFRQSVSQLSDKTDDFLVPRHILHG